MTNRMDDLKNLEIKCTTLSDWDKRTVFRASWETDDHHFHLNFTVKNGEIRRPDCIYKNKKIRDKFRNHAIHLYTTVEKNAVVVREILRRCSDLTPFIAAKQAEDAEEERIARVKQIESVTRQANALGFKLVPMEGAS